MGKPLLSVCLITYNHVKYIRQAIDSVLMQEVNFSWELIIADDFSTDGTREILLEYKKNNPNFIKLILQKKNIGPAENWLQLIKQPKSKYIAYLDGDDFWLSKNKLQKQVDFLQNNKEYVIHSGFAKTLANNDSENTIIGQETKNGFFELKDFYTKNNINSSTIMFRNNLDELSNHFSFVKFGDWFLYVMLLKEDKSKAYITKEVLSRYRVHNNGIMMSMSILNNLNAHVNQIIYIKKYLNFKFKFPNDISLMNDYLTRKFDIEISTKRYLEASKTFILSVRYLGFYKYYFKTIIKLFLAK